MAVSTLGGMNHRRRSARTLIENGRTSRPCTRWAPCPAATRLTVSRIWPAMSESGSRTGTTLNTINMRRIEIRKVRTRMAWCGPSVAAPGTARRPISRRPREVVADLPCRLMEQGFAVSAVLKT